MAAISAMTSTCFSFNGGTYDWGSGDHFELDLTRQVILPDEEDDDAIWQLHLTYRFSPSDELHPRVLHRGPSPGPSRCWSSSSVRDDQPMFAS